MVRRDGFTWEARWTEHLDMIRRGMIRHQVRIHHLRYQIARRRCPSDGSRETNRTLTR